MHHADILGCVPEPDFFVHETAIVEDGATIGAGCSIWHHAHIRTGAELGPGCVIGKNVFVDAGVTVGARCKIQNNVSVYSGVTIGDDVFVGPAATFTNDLVPRAFSSDWTVTETMVRTGASVGANATLVCGNDLGAYSMVAAGSVVTNDVADHALVVGNPARHRAWVCRCGNVVSRDAARPSDLSCAACRHERAS
ncbi:MAG: N-acetyltransferase [Ilumatobacter sp.]|nr:N-acetyltransferase [Ilumatobacter sp.]